MRLSDIKEYAVENTLREMGSIFTTFDVSNHDTMQSAHRGLTGGNYHAMVGSYLSRERQRLGIDSTGRGSGTEMWRKLNSGELAEDQQREDAIRAVPAGAVVRPGHYRSLAYMSSDDFLEVKDLFESYPQIGGVYFRCTDKGITVVDLDPTSLKPRIGVGSDIAPGTTARSLRWGIADRLQQLDKARSDQRSPSRENQFEARLIREAQGDELCLPGFPDRLRFVYSQWRANPTPAGGQRFTDLIAVDLVARRLVIIELKAAPDPSAFGQVNRYVDYFNRHSDELFPFFAGVARAMGSLYSCPELCSIDELSGTVTGLVCWPDASGSVQVHGLEHLSHAGMTEQPITEHSASDIAEIGPQYPGVTSFAARMRFHQSWYRAKVLRVPCGTGPSESSRSHYGNMLGSDDAEKGLNFVTPEAFVAAKDRLADRQGVVERFRLLHNMLSSQPMCFNLFGPLAADLDLATTAFQALIGTDEVHRVTSVRFEYAPSPRREYLNDGTAFDAFVTYQRPDRSLGFVGIETKLTEPFSAGTYDKPAYRRWMELPDSPWLKSASERVAKVEHNQLWRDHLLAVAMLRHPGSAYSAGRVLLVRHSGDDECAVVAEGYRKLLRPDVRSFSDIALDHLIGLWQEYLPETCKEWLDTFRLRYVDLGASEQEWQRYKG